MNKLDLCANCYHPKYLHITEHGSIYCSQLNCRCGGKVTQYAPKSENQELIQRSKDIHGELYHKINSLQRDLNIANAECERSKTKISILEDQLKPLSFDIYFDKNTNDHQLICPWCSPVRTNNPTFILKCKHNPFELTHKVDALNAEIREIKKTSFTPAEHSKIIKTFKQAINILEQ